MENEKLLRGFFLRDATIWQYTAGVRDKEAISPDNWNGDQPLLGRPGNAKSTSRYSFYSFGNPALIYSTSSAPTRRYIRSGRRISASTNSADVRRLGTECSDLSRSGSEPYKRDLKKFEFYLLVTWAIVFLPMRSRFTPR